MNAINNDKLVKWNKTSSVITAIIIVNFSFSKSMYQRMVFQHFLIKFYKV